RRNRPRARIAMTLASPARGALYGVFLGMVDRPFLRLQPGGRCGEGGSTGAAPRCAPHATTRRTSAITRGWDRAPVAEPLVVAVRLDALGVMISPRSQH